MTKLSDAIQDVRGYLDDRQKNADGTYGRRWTDAQVIRALHSAISSCVDEATAKGLDNFIEEVPVKTDATGVVSLLKYDPLRIRSVIVTQTQDGFTFPVHPADPNIRGTADNTARDLLIRLVRRPALPDVATDVLIGVVDGAMRSWPAFDRWVCMVAAIELGITDRDSRQELYAAEQTLREKILTVQRIPQTLPWPRERRRWLWDLRWLWTPRAASLSMHLAGVRGW